MDLASIKKAIDQIEAVTRHQPIRVKMNSQWLDKNVSKIDKYTYENKFYPINGVGTLYGLPVEIDDTIETYEFIYADGKY